MFWKNKNYHIDLSLVEMITNTCDGLQRIIVHFTSGHEEELAGTAATSFMFTWENYVQITTGARMTAVMNVDSVKSCGDSCVCSKDDEDTEDDNDEDTGNYPWATPT